MRRLCFAVLLAALLAAAAVPALAKDVVFQTPSKKIACRVYDEGAGLVIRCDLFFLNDRAVRMTRHGKARLIHVSDTIGDPRAQVLHYGKTKRVGPFTCTSRRRGLSCHNGSGHGFTVSREHQSVH